MPVIAHTHLPGNHCASTAISDLVRFHGLDWNEAFCFGLGGGLGINYVSQAGQSPSRMLHTRSLNFEERFFKAIGIKDFQWATFTDVSEAENDLLAAIDANRPALMLTDLYYLHYFNSSTHFPCHVILVWGYDKKQSLFLVSDTEREQLEQVSFDAMRKARVADQHHFTHMSNMFAPAGLPTPDKLAEICRDAIRGNARSLLDTSDPGLGLQALQRCKDELAHWRDDNDWQWTSRFAYQTIEKRGTGGGAFRKMYAEFLREAAEIVPAIKDSGLADKMTACAENWSKLALAFKAVSEAAKPDFQSVERCLADLISEEEHYCYLASRI